MISIGRVYMIISPTGKFYVGSTIKTFKVRWWHYYNLNCKSQTKLYYSLKKYGPENHTFHKIWEGNIKDMYMIEAKYGRLLNVLDNEKGLNCKLPKESDEYCSISLETKKKMSDCKKGKIHSEESNRKRSISNKGQIISVEHRKKISNANTGRKLSNKAKQKMSFSKIGKNLSLKHKQNIGKSLQKIVIQLDLNGNIKKEWSSLKDAALFFNIHYSNISNCCKGKQKFAAGFKWKYK